MPEGSYKRKSQISLRDEAPASNAIERGWQYENLPPIPVRFCCPCCSGMLNSIACLACCCPCATLMRCPAQYPQESRFHKGKAKEARVKYVLLPDERRLEYAVYGAEKGAIIYFHNQYMASAYMGAKDGAFDELAKKENVKIITVSAPGFGLSSSYPLGRCRKLSEWPADVVAVLDAEKVKKCHFYGISDGCANVAALVDALPRERVGNVVFACPPTPDCVPGMKEGVDIGTLIMQRNLGKPYVGDCFAFMMSRCMKTKTRMALFSDIKEALITGNEKFPAMSEIAAKSFDHGVSYTHRGIVDNFGTMEEDLYWIKRLSEKVKMGHRIGVTWSLDDTMAPKAMQKWWLSQIEGAVEMEFETGWGHMHASIDPENITRIWTFLKTGIDEEDSQAATVL